MSKQQGSVHNEPIENMSYDENGNLLTVTNGCGTTNYTWDARNRLIGVNGFKPDCSSLTASFRYDALDRRIEKAINDKTTQYLYDGLDIVQEIESGVVSANYVHTLNIDEPLARIKADGTIRYYQTDALGSVLSLTDSSGAVKTQYAYEPFGKVTVSGELSDNPFQYTGREDDETGLYYYRARYYSLELQRFISEDPIGFEGGDMNFYVYSQNNPVTFIDPDGLQHRTPSQGPPNSTQSFPDGRGGRTDRIYGPDGRALKDIDYGHDHGSGDPHVHDWDWSKDRPRSPGRPPKPGESRGPVPWWRWLPWRWPGPFPIIFDPCFLDPTLPGCKCSPEA